MRPITGGARIGGHVGAVTCVAFAPDSDRFLTGDAAGNLVLRSRTGEVLASARIPATRTYSKPWVYSVAWSPDGLYVAAMEDDVARLRNATDLGVVNELEDIGIGPLVFCNAGATLAVATDRVLRLHAVPSLAESATVPIERRRLSDFTTYAVTSDPAGTLVATGDAGGRDEDDAGHTIDRDSPQITLFDATTGKVLSAVEDGELSYDVVFDPFRRYLYSITFKGVGIWSPDGKLVKRWEPYAARTATNERTWCRHVAVNARYLATVPDTTWRTPRTIDLWDPETYMPVASIETPDGPSWIAASPDGTLLVTPADVQSGDHGVRLWKVGRALAP